MGSIASEDEEVTVEVRAASPAHYLLKIESFSLLSESGVEKIESNEFEAGGYKWKMIIYPDGKRSDKGSEHVSVYLALSGTSSLPAGWEVNAIYNFFCSISSVTIIFQCEEKCGAFILSSPCGDFPNLCLTKHSKRPQMDTLLMTNVCLEIFVIQRQAISECLSMVKSNDSFKREWKICNFSNLGQDWFSEEFTVGGYKWKLLLYPKGDANSKGCDISIFLQSVDAKDFDHRQKVKAKCLICLKDQINGECKKLSYWNWFSTTVKSWGYLAFMPLTELHDQKKGYLVNDCIVVEVEVEVVFKHTVKSLS